MPIANTYFKIFFFVKPNLKNNKIENGKINKNPSYLINDNNAINAKAMYTFLKFLLKNK